MWFSVKNQLKMSPEPKNAPSLSLCGPLSSFPWNWPPPHTKIKRNSKKRQKRCLLALRSVWGELPLALRSVWGELSMGSCSPTHPWGALGSQGVQKWTPKWVSIPNHGHRTRILSVDSQAWPSKSHLESRTGHQNECWFPNMAIEIGSSMGLNAPEVVTEMTVLGQNHTLSPEGDIEMSADSQIWASKSHLESNTGRQNGCWCPGMAIEITSCIQNWTPKWVLIPKYGHRNWVQALASIEVVTEMSV